MWVWSDTYRELISWHALFQKPMKKQSRAVKFLKSLAVFSASERRGLAIVGIAVAVFLLILWLFPRRLSVEQYTSIADSIRKASYTDRPVAPVRPLVELNTADSATLTSVSGIGPYIAARIIEYRHLNGRFDSTAQLATLRGMRPENLARIIPQIYIDTAILSSIPRKTPPPPTPKPTKPKVYIDLNTADSAALISVVGLGPTLTNRIIRYRSRLGGFIKTEQLMEINGITSDNFLQISTQIFADSARIQKIDVTFAPVSILAGHPYIGQNMARRIAKARELKGGYNNLQELIDKDILLPHEARKIEQYVVFGQTH